MRALLVVRPNAQERPGGDTKLAYDTLAAIQKLGVDAQLVESDTPDARGYDIAHIFNVGQPDVCRRQMDACVSAGVRIALSPVWLDLREFLGKAFAYERLFSKERSEHGVDRMLDRWHGRTVEAFLDRRQRRDLGRRLSAQRALLEASHVLLPNSAIEARDCLVQLGVRDKPLVTVLIPGDLEPARYWQTERHGLICLGRVETRKNQTGLAYALRHDAIEIDLVGAIYDPGLAATCARWCPRARFYDRVEREAAMSMLGRAEIHSLVSWCETAGLATLEAAAAGAKIVVADRGAEVEYFGDDAEYADPSDPSSIRAAVLRAAARPPRRPGDSLDRRIRHLSWEHAGRETMRAYEIALQGYAAGG